MGTLAEQLGVSQGDAARISLASAGVWWAIFTIIPLVTLKHRAPRKKLPQGEHYATIGFKQLWHTLSELPKFPFTLLYLAAYLFFNDGIQTVISMSAVFGSAEMGMDVATLAKLILMVQFVAFFGALLLQLACAARGHKARDHDQPRAVAGRDDLHLCLPEFAVAVFHTWGRDCHRARGQPGVEPFALLAHDPTRPGSGVFRPLRGQRARHKLAGAVAFRPHACS